jgi:hypothetical protein
MKRGGEFVNDDGFFSDGWIALRKSDEVDLAWKMVP